MQIMFTEYATKAAADDGEAGSTSRTAFFLHNVKPRLGFFTGWKTADDNLIMSNDN